MEVELRLTSQECLAMEETVETALWSLREQIRHCDDHAFKDGLKTDELVLVNILAKARAALHAGAEANR